MFEFIIMFPTHYFKYMAEKTINYKAVKLLWMYKKYA